MSQILRNQPGAVTVLSSPANTLTKEFRLDASGALKNESYGKAYKFTINVEPVSDIRQLATLISKVSKDKHKMLIRGQPKTDVWGLVERRNDNFEEPADGLRWAMLDFDNIPLPEGVSPYSNDAIEYVISRLPEPFHTASYYYQFSSSTGICHPDGTPLKAGLNVHLFFWFSRPIKGYVLKAYLHDHCLRTDFFVRDINRGGMPCIKYGVDFSLFHAVQPHYVAAPIIGDGVICLLPPEQRQGLVDKASSAVTLPEIAPNLFVSVNQCHAQLLTEHKLACGWVQKRSMTRAARGEVAISEYYENPNPDAVQLGRVLVDVKTRHVPRENEAPLGYATLYFEDESSPGSWYVKSTSPTMARRHGDHASVHLKELSAGAYEHVRDQLGWFSDMATQTLALSERGFLPDISTFANARNCIILAPTGAGKTTAFCRYATAHRRDIIIYAAQTRALTRQMKADLKDANVCVIHYQDDFHPYEVPPGVYVTTNESLFKIYNAVIDHSKNYILVVDEAHIALDDFMNTNDKNKVLDQAITRASKTLLMTATLTDLQHKKWQETISKSTGEMTPENFALYQFAPVKNNPLWLADVNDFDADFVALLRSYQAMKQEGEPLPRTIVIAPTSKMRKFKLMLDYFGLSEDAMVVSRDEACEEEMEAARVGTQPILISSPVFALGLNFESLPEKFWTYFRYLDVDESQIIQTLNRANRDSNLCEVRLYAGPLDANPYAIPPEILERAKVDAAFREETTIAGLLDEHFQIDRETYLQLRKAEKNTEKALYRLITNDAIQNYTVVDDWEEYLNVTAEDEDLAKSFARAAKEAYKDDVVDQVPGYAEETPYLLLHLMEQNRRKSRVAPTKDTPLPRKIKDERQAISMALAGTTNYTAGGKIKSVKQLRLFGDLMVFLSGQYSLASNPEWMMAAAEKTHDMLHLLGHLRTLKTRLIDGVQFGWIMRRPNMRKAILALVSNERDLLDWRERLEGLEKDYEQCRNKASKRQREALERTAFKMAMEFLGEIGITFAKVKNDKGREVFHPKHVIFPDWDLRAMHERLERKAESLKRMPVEGIDRNQVHKAWAGPPINQGVCTNCVHMEPCNFCALGRPVLGHDEEIEEGTNECDAFYMLPRRIRNRQDE